MKLSELFRRHDSPGPAELHRQLSRWYAHPARARALRELRALLMRYLNDRFGYYALKLASFTVPDDCPVETRTRFSFHLGPRGADAQLRFEALPIEAESVDLIIALHTLEFTDDPHLVLREFDRVLIPDGYLIVVGFNPYGRPSLLKPLHLRRGVPWCGHFHSSWQLQEWLSVLGFAVEEIDSCVVPWVCRAYERPFGRWAKLLPCLGDLLVLKACKKVSRLTPLPELSSKPARKYRA